MNTSLNRRPSAQSTKKYPSAKEFQRIYEKSVIYIYTRQDESRRMKARGKSEPVSISHVSGAFGLGVGKLQFPQGLINCH